jgi:serine/threonine-protein kinase RsbT
VIDAGHPGGHGASDARGGPPPLRISIRSEADVAAARARARMLALQQGLAEAGACAVATAVSEIAWNIVVHAGRGEVLLAPAVKSGRRGVIAVARDRAPGIADVARAMEDGFSTRRGLGLGLSAARRLMDEFEIESAVGAGTTVTMRKWAHAG